MRDVYVTRNGTLPPRAAPAPGRATTRRAAARTRRGSGTGAGYSLFLFRIRGVSPRYGHTDPSIAFDYFIILRLGLVTCVCGGLEIEPIVRRGLGRGSGRAAERVGEGPE